MTAPNKINLLKWIAALRSGSYRQASGVLRETFHSGPEATRYCCLGVACELFRQANPEDGRWQKECFATKSHHMFSTLPPEVQEWLGIGYADPILCGINASVRNDLHQQDFLAIADAIEAEFKLTEEPSHA
jgi:hypothetical protein